ncbi:hypothetical protein [Altererythrobacter aquiaggeris]|uniref:hypothetical protein n=1 Tax=Aestuarierythrobacter aquiaggeris TaxID=1898396 RepID=UPI003019E398
MRVIVVLVILALALIAAAVMRSERESDFNYRFERAEQRIKDLARDIDEDLEKK